MPPVSPQTGCEIGKKPRRKTRLFSRLQVQNVETPDRLSKSSGVSSTFHSLRDPSRIGPFGSGGAPSLVSSGGSCWPGQVTIPGAACPVKPGVLLVPAWVSVWLRIGSGRCRQPVHRPAAPVQSAAGLLDVWVDHPGGTKEKSCSRRC